MAKPDPNFRPDPDRAINIFGDFSDELVAEVLPRIAALRAQGNKPITVYINSRGGVVRCLEVILGAIMSEDLDEEGCFMITVASGDAASAAASLFALGGYAIAYPHSVFHFHGVRMGEVEVTMEDASSLANYLSQRNRIIALRLAEAMISRLVHRYSLLMHTFDEHRRRSSNKDLSEVECFVDCVRGRVSPTAERVLDQSLVHIRRVQKLSDEVFGTVNLLPQDNGLKHDANVLQAVLDYEVRTSVGDWRLNEQGLAQVAADYFLLRDFYIGEHEATLSSVVETFGYFFLNARDAKHFVKLRDNKTNRTAAKKFLARKAGPIVKVFWYFTVVMCRQLQQGENRLEAVDAYWLGVADEVVGLGLTGVRAMMEEDLSDATVS